MYNSDGLPKFYTDVTENVVLMGEMKREVFSILDNHFVTDVKEVCELADINRMFENEVSDFIEEYKANLSLKKAGVAVCTNTNVNNVK